VRDGPRMPPYGVYCAVSTRVFDETVSRNVSPNVSRNLARAFLMLALMTVISADFLNSSEDRSHDFRILFVILVNFSSLTALMRESIGPYDILSPYTLFTDDSNSCQLFATLTSALTKSPAAVTVLAIGFNGFSGVWTSSAGKTADPSRYLKYSSLKILYFALRV
jgi:hypothetical protein